MSQSLTYTCDVCGAVKREANHWFRVLVACRGVSVRFTIVPWGCGTGRQKQEMHLCGLECAHKAMAKALTEGQ